MPSSRPCFRIWIRRAGDPETTFSIQFTLTGARGLLAVARPGGTREAPAAIQGVETDLTGEEIRGTRFVVSLAPGRVEEYLLVALGDGLLERLPDACWIPLVPRTAGTLRLLLPRIPPSEASAFASSDEIPHTQPISRPDVRRALRAALAKAAGRAWEPAPAGGDPDLLTTLPPDRPQPSRPPEVDRDVLMPVEEDVVVYLGEETEEGGQEGPASRTGAHRAPAPEPVADRPVIPADLAPPPPEGMGAFGSRLSSLVRFLRREQERDHAEISRLRARIAELEAERALAAPVRPSDPSQ
ncbi:MAG: hypothetical protein JXB39_05880 [Deltaproteobacteria bacterium]|nr:hypothetical protein [Deltaproteobacteria bacterium]